MTDRHKTSAMRRAAHVVRGSLDARATMLGLELAIGLAVTGVMILSLAGLHALA